MTDFAQLRQWLLAWYAHADHLAFQRFAEGWLKRAAIGRANHARLAPDEVDDFVQMVLEDFANRERQPGRDALRKAFWSHRIALLLRRFLTKRSRWRRLHAHLRDESPTDGAPTPGGGHGQDDAAVEDDLLRSLDRPRHRDRLAAVLSTMPAAERLAFIVAAWHALDRTLVRGHDLDLMAARSGRSIRALRALLDGSTPGRVVERLPALFTPAQLAQHRQRCLGAFQRARYRARLRVLAAFEAHREAGP